MQTVLGVLREARRAVDEGRFQYKDWTRCTCGQLLRATGHRPSSRGEGAVRLVTDPLFVAALEAVLSAYGGDVDAVRARSAAGGYRHDGHYVVAPSSGLSPQERYVWCLTAEVSIATVAVSRRLDPSRRSGARALLDAAIERLEAAEAEARLDVLAQARTDVAAADAADAADDARELVPA
jgi:hypothetical protein